MTLPSMFFLGEPDGHLEFFLSFVRHVRASSIADADFIIYPNLIRLEKRNTTIDIAIHTTVSREARNKPIILFVFNDYEMIVKCKTNPTIVYRTGVSKFWRLPNEFVLPFLWIIPPDELCIRPPRRKPVVGFCGTLLGRRSRRATLDHFRASRQFECNFLVRDRFMGGGRPTDQSVVDFFDNIEASDFVICDRGRGNWTIRLYEALSRGRIPVQYDTGGSLPRVMDGSWEDAIIEAPDREDLEKKMMEVWAGDLAARQRYCRTLWEDNLSVPGFANILSADLVSFRSRVERGERMFRYSALQTIFLVIRYLMHLPGAVIKIT